MPIDPSIPLQADTSTPLKLAQLSQSVSPLDSYQKGLTLSHLMQQQQVGNLALQKAQQERDDDSKLRSIYSSPEFAADPSKGGQLLRAQGLHKQSIEYDKAFNDQAKSQLEIRKSQGEIIKQYADQVMANPTRENLIRAFTNFGKDTGKDMTESIKWAESLDNTPDTIRQVALAYAGHAEKLIPKNDSFDLNGSRQFYKIDPVTGKVILTGEVQKTVSPEAYLNDKREREIAFAKDSTQRESNAQSRLKFNNETGEFGELPQVQPSPSLLSPTAGNGGGLSGLYQGQSGAQNGRVGTVGMFNGISSSGQLPESAIKQGNSSRNSVLISELATERANLAQAQNSGNAAQIEASTRNINALNKELGIKSTASPSATPNPTQPTAGKIKGWEGSKESQQQKQQVKNANEVLGIINLAEPLLKKSTSSGIGNLMDEGSALFGHSTKGAQAAAKLKALGGLLVSKMPRMEGPQSDKDVLLYREMAGQIGDPSIPYETKLAALQTIREINTKYAQGEFNNLSSNAKPSPNSSSDGWGIRKLP